MTTTIIWTIAILTVLGAALAVVLDTIPGFDPTNTLVVGDSLSSDIRGGINAGLATCWYNPHGKPVPADMKIDYVVRSLDEILPIILN